MSGGATTKSLNRVAPRRGKQKISPRPTFCPCYELAGVPPMLCINEDGSAILMINFIAYIR
jgi:hypothetical protein